MEKGISVRGKWQGILIMKDWKGRGRHDTMTGVHTNFKKGMVILYIKRTYFTDVKRILEKGFLKQSFTTLKYFS